MPFNSLKALRLALGLEAGSLCANLKTLNLVAVKRL